MAGTAGSPSETVGRDEHSHDSQRGLAPTLNLEEAVAERLQLKVSRYVGCDR
jgi:hypothetical protein